MLYKYTKSKKTYKQYNELLNIHERNDHPISAISCSFLKHSSMEKFDVTIIFLGLINIDEPLVSALKGYLSAYIFKCQIKHS